MKYFKRVCKERISARAAHNRNRSCETLAIRKKKWYNMLYGKLS